MARTSVTPAGTRGLSRRRFMVNASATLGAFAIGVRLPAGGRMPRAEAATSGTTLSAYVIVGSDERVTLMYGGSELGQGTMSGLAQIIAEELKVAWEKIRIEQADFTLSNIDGKPPGSSAVVYLTAGSGAVKRQYDKLRLAGAAAREMLIAAGAAAMGVAPSQCHAENGVVIGPSGSKTYGELAAAAALLPVPVAPALTPPAEFRYIGKRMERQDIPLKVQGKAVYGIDVRLEGMLYASVVHCPTYGGILAKVPSTPSGVIAVIPLTAPESRGATQAGDVNAVAVVTDSNTWKAMRAARSLQLTWVVPPASAELDDAVIAQQAADAMAKGVGYLAEPARGDVATALAAATTLNATYSLPYVPHVCMEVLNCTVHHRGTSCEIWAPVQAAAWVHDEAVKLTGLSKDAITVHTTFLGGGLGRKIERDYYSQAIQVGIKMQGQPVKLTWSREEDTRFDQFRPTALINVQARLAAGGRIAAWKYRHVSPSISRQRGRSMTSADTQATEGCYALPYAMDASRIEWVENPARVPVGYWRSVGYSLNAFAVESAIDELALAAGIDPMTFRKNLMAASPRPLAVLEMADKYSQWRKTLPSGRAWGMAYGEAFGTHVCQVVEVSGSATALRVNRVLCVVDCGMAVNPGSVEMQMQGGIIHGLNAAMWGRQKFVAGKPQIANFNTYRMLRVSEAPQVEVQILNSGQPVSGVGEPGVPPIAPAVANAYFRLTGIRKRKLPFFA